MALNPFLVIRTIIFDLGGVLVDWDPRYLYRKLFDSEAEMEYFLTHVCNPAWNIRQDAGRPIAEATRELAEQHPQYQELIQAFYGRWSEMLAGDIPETVNLLEALAEQDTHRLLALTNWSHETFHFAEQRFGWLSHFEGVVVSGRENMAKPDPRIFHLLADRYGICPEESVFIDDNPSNVQTADHLGFSTVAYRDPEQLEQALSAKRIFISSG